MKKTVLLTIVVSLLLSGCIRLQYQRSITPGIDRIDNVIFGERHPDDSLLHEPVRNLPNNLSSRPLIEEKMKKEEKAISDKLTNVYKDISLEAIQQEFIHIKSPCEAISTTHLKCDYKILGYIDIRPPLNQDFVKVTLDFQREGNQTAVTFIAFRCNACEVYRETRDLSLEVVNYFKKLKPETLIYNLGDVEVFMREKVK